jgi:hypothetical protein
MDALAVARQVARYLPGWHAVLQASDWAVTVCLVNSDGARVTMTVSDGKLHASGCYPPTEMRVDYGGINVSITRPPVVIAGEIERRLLSRYLPQLAEVIAYNARDLADRERRSEVIAGIGAMFPGAYIRDSGYRGQFATAHIHPARCGSGSVEAYGNAATVKIELGSVPLDLAKAMLTVLAEWAYPEGEWFRVEDAHPRWEIKNPHGDGKNYLCTDEAIRTFGREHIESVILRNLAPLPAEAWEVIRSRR